MRASDEELIRICRSDVRAFEELFSRYRRRLYALARTMLRSPQEAEEVTQDAFMRIHRAAGSFKPGYKFSSWALKITSNLCKNRLKKRRLPVTSLDDGAHEESHLASDSPTPLEIYEKEIAKQQIDEAIAVLPEVYREALFLRYSEDLSYKDIAEVLGVSLSAVETRIHRAKRLLRSKLASLV